HHAETFSSLLFLFGNEVLCLKVRHLASDADREAGGVEVANGPNAAAPLEEALRDARCVLPQGVESPDAADHCATGGRSHVARSGGVGRFQYPDAPARNTVQSLVALRAGCAWARARPRRCFSSPLKTKL